MRMSHRVALFVLLCWPWMGTRGQWLKYPTPGIPRTADGKPNLNAPIPPLQVTLTKRPVRGWLQRPPGLYCA